MHGNFRLVMALCAGTVLGASALRVVQAQSSPPAYAVIQSTIIDQDAFRQFLPQIGAVMQHITANFSLVAAGLTRSLVRRHLPTSPSFSLQV